ncbi:Aste57867_17123 [Aphanomyces stellatus]|uniref:Aste57867_17123 protein n=1 Tax=Aphanomyces stellatus TaxID=120398 RepID=A0A485LAG2_9STRA|nr:hypothetical protein As57867_017064 [Aphanomyces stellatus]VFT93881.1 Aste57867_17123 [Aphanomyces stellatus]
MLRRSVSSLEDERRFDALTKGTGAAKNTSPMMDTCVNCGKAGATFPCVGRCGGVLYCSTDCVLFHNQMHRTLCFTLRHVKRDEAADDENGDDLHTDDETETADDMDEDPLFMALRSTSATVRDCCAHCGKTKQMLPCLGRCGLVFYCSTECVLLDAPAHRKACFSSRLHDDKLESAVDDTSAPDEGRVKDDDDVDATATNDLPAPSPASISIPFALTKPPMAFATQRHTCAWGTPIDTDDDGLFAKFIVKQGACATCGSRRVVGFWV